MGKLTHELNHFKWNSQDTRFLVYEKNKRKIERGFTLVKLPPARPAV